MSHASLQDLDNDRFAKADLHCKLANICGDLQSKKLTQTGNFKMLVSGDTVRAQKKHGQPFDYRNYSKLIYSANQIPESEDQTYAYFKRWVIVVFDRIFEGEEKDPNLIDKLTTDEELSGLLNLATNALKRLIRFNGFTHSYDVETVMKEYNQRVSTVDDFLASKCHIDITDRERFMIGRDAYHEYVQYCINNNNTPVEDNIFGSYLVPKGIKKERKMVNWVREYCYIGMSLLQ